MPRLGGGGGKVKQILAMPGFSQVLAQPPLPKWNQVEDHENNMPLSSVSTNYVCHRRIEGKDVPTGSTKLKTASGEEVKADRGKFVQVSIIVILLSKVLHHSFDDKHDGSEESRIRENKVEELLIFLQFMFCAFQSKANNNFRINLDTFTLSGDKQQ